MADRERIETITLDEWKARAKDGAAPNDCRLIKAYSGVVILRADDDEEDEDEDEDEEERGGGRRSSDEDDEEDEDDDEAKADDEEEEEDKPSLRIRITTSQRDRDRDTIAASGWQLDNYRKNPVVLWAHNYHGLPIGRDTGIIIDAQGLLAAPKFCEPDENPMGAMVERLLRRRYLNAASIGMIPTTWQFNEEERGVDFLTQELLEYSIVPVPANPGALVEARSAGIEITPLLSWCEQVLDETLGAGTILVPKGQLEQAYRIVSREKVLFAMPSVQPVQPVVAPTKAKKAADPEPKPEEPPPTPTPEEASADDELVFELVDVEPAKGADDDMIEVPDDLEQIVGEVISERAQRSLTALTGRLD